MKKYLLPILALGILFIFAACSDSQGGGGAGSGEGGLGRFSEDTPEIKTLPAPEVEQGVVPELVGVSLGDSEAAIKEAGFKVGDISGGVGVGTVFPPTLAVCSQDPEPGGIPKKGSAIDLNAEVACE